MGITIYYRGRLADLSRIEDFEDRLVDLALEVGGLAQKVVERLCKDSRTIPSRRVRSRGGASVPQLLAEPRLSSS